MNHRILPAVALLALAPACSRTTAPKEAAAPACDRTCLNAMVDTYFAALVGHDPSQVPLAPDVQFVEQAKRIQPGEGLWKTASAAPSAFKIYVPDPVSEQVGFLGMMEEDGKPVQIGLRLKLVDGRITEAEHLLARNLRESSLANLQTPRPAFSAIVPVDQRDSRDDMLRIGAAAHVFKVYGGKMHEIEAMGFGLPYDSPTGWE